MLKNITYQTLSFLAGLLLLNTAARAQNLSNKG
jgi:hypothetical protein